MRTRSVHAPDGAGLVRRPTLVRVSTTSHGPRQRVGLASTRVALGVAALAALGACGRDEPARTARAAPAQTPAAEVAAVSHLHTWDDAAGLGLLVRAGSGQEMLVTPDSVDARRGVMRVAGAPGGGVVLFGRAGMLGRAHTDSTFAGMALAGSCATWSAVRLGPASGAEATPAWSVGFVVPEGAAQPAALALDSLEVLAARDSATLTAAVTRLAAALPDTGARGAARRPALRGVPFRVRDAHRFTLADGSTAVVAVLTRTVNTEATPFADQLLLVAERRAPGPWAIAYAESVAGAEESLPAMDVLAAVQLPGSARPAAPAAVPSTVPASVPPLAAHVGPARAALILGRDGDDGSRFTLLERDAPGRWHPRWTSAVCRMGEGRHAS